MTRKRNKKTKIVPITAICIATAELHKVRDGKLRALRIPLIDFYGLTITNEY